MSQELNEKQSLNIITSMIEKAKGDIGANSIFYLIWGWMALFAAVSQYIMLLYDFKFHFIAWVILMPLAGIIVYVYGKKNADKLKGGYTQKAMSYLWGAFTFFLILVLVNGFAIGWGTAYAFLIGLIGTATFISGGILDFRPLKIGGALSWALAFSAFHMELASVVLAIAGSMVVSYLVPGYLLKKTYAQKA